MLRVVGKWGFSKGVLIFQIKDRQFNVPDWGPDNPGVELDIEENGIPVGVAYRSRFYSFWHLKVEGRHYILPHANPEFFRHIPGFSGEVEVSV